MFRAGLIFILVLYRIPEVFTQCSGVPELYLPNNSTGRIAYPPGNLDPISGTWTKNHQYPTNKTCTWILRAPALHTFYVKILDFQTEANFDFVKMYSSESREKELFSLSGSPERAWETFIQGETLVIDFMSDELTAYYGFHIAYQYMPRACLNEGVIIKEPQLIAVPPWNLQGAIPGPKREGLSFSDPSQTSVFDENSPAKVLPSWSELSTYPQGLNCTWKIEVSPSQLLQINVLKFHTDPDDVLQVWQLTSSGLKPILKFWSDQIPQEKIESSSPLLLNFLSDVNEIGRGSGFLLNVSYISRSCHPAEEILTAPRGVIAYPKQNLDNNGRWLNSGEEEGVSYAEDVCQWKITAPPGYSINITVLNFDVREKDHFQIVEDDHVLIGHVGGKLTDLNGVSNGNEISVQFSSPSDSINYGFLISYTWFLKDCHFKLSPDKSGGEVRSPYYPETYRSDMKCQWKLNTPAGFIAQFLIYRIRLDSGDYLQITDGEKNAFLSKELGTTGMWTFSQSKPVSVNFMSSDKDNKGYFLLKYNTYRPGSCDFSLTSCDYEPIDPLLIWDFNATERILFIDETVLGIQLPRGYKTKLISPLIDPSSFEPKQSKKGEHPTSSPHPMCLALSFILNGEDAFKFSVSQQSIGQGPAQQQPLLEVHGPQGDIQLTKFVNFTAGSPFQLLLAYERGYGPHYRLVIKSIQVLPGFCQYDVEKLSTFSCNFTDSFCGWSNTHMDHKNWLLNKDGGITANVKLPGISKSGGVKEFISSVSSTNNGGIADLVSPILTLKDLFLRKESSTQSSIKGSGNGGQFSNSKGSAGQSPANDLCLEMFYEIHHSSSELKVVIAKTSMNNRTDDYQRLLFDQRRKNEYEIWSQGRVRSHQVLATQIPLARKLLPDIFKILLRSSSVKETNPNPSTSDAGITVKSIHLQPHQCENYKKCDFTTGFCSWKVRSTGNTVWHITNNEEDPDNYFAAIYSADTMEKVAEIISPVVSVEDVKSVSFRYRLQETNQCLQVGVSAADDVSATKYFIWEQCKGKSLQWLQECIDFTGIPQHFQVILQSTTGPDGSEMWVDDLELSSKPCNSVRSQYLHSNSPENAKVIWTCDPINSLCGMTQPNVGVFQWTFQKNRRDVAQLPESYGLYKISMQKPVKSQHRKDFQGSQHDSVSFDREFDLQNHLGSPQNEEIFHDNFQELSEALLFTKGKTNHFGTVFQCPEGRIIEPQLVCDGIPDCDDSSDEDHCDCGPEGCGNNEDTVLSLGPGICNEGSFRCPSGRICPPEGCPHGISPCLPRSHLCDGFVHCNEGEDESSCRGVVRDTPKMEFGWQGDAPHSPVQNYKHYRAYNNYLEMDQSHKTKGQAQQSPETIEKIECSGGLLVPLSFRCDGRKDCPLDGLDEVGCNHCGLNQFACPTSGVCLPQSSVCDGTMSISSCTDEENCKSCPPAHFACDICLPSFRVCDGVWDCSEGEDELRCLKTRQIMSSESLEKSINYRNQQEKHSRSFHQEHQMFPENIAHSLPEEIVQNQHTSPEISSNTGACHHYQFTCLGDSSCIGLDAVCDRKMDCLEGEDEINCYDDNKQEEYTISVKPTADAFKMEEYMPSYLISPVFQHASEDEVGILAFQYRLDAWIGASNVTLSVEILDGNFSKSSVLPWAIWRQSGHKGTNWSKTSVIIPKMPNVDYYRIAFLVHSNGVPSITQQIHLAKISFARVKVNLISHSGLHVPLCEFGESWCGWSQSYTDRGYSWVHAMASPHSRRTGPITGYPDGASTGFVFADSLYGVPGDTADLLSPPLILSEKRHNICFRFAAFLFGAHVDKLSVHAIQANPKGGHPFVTQLFQTIGGQGLSWVTVSLSIKPANLMDPTQPFVLIVRATRGNGPEADIAIDHISFESGLCDSGIQETRFDPNLLLETETNFAFSYINSLKVGPSFTPFREEHQHSAVDGVEGNADYTEDLTDLYKPKVDICTSASGSCSLCVDSPMTDCIWCSATYSCVNQLSIEGLKCHEPSVIWNKQVEKTKAGSSWCPQITISNGEETIYVVSGSNVALTFPVTNIQAVETDGSWKCRFELEASKDPEISKQLSILKEISAHNFLEGDDLKLLTEIERSLKSQPIVLQVNGHFKGNLFNPLGGGNTEDSSSTAIGVGSINCRSEETLFEAPKSQSSIKALVQLVSPSGNVLDNSQFVQVIIYNCNQMAFDCLSCLNLNETLSCGWCPTSQMCSPRAHCNGRSWYAHIKGDGREDACKQMFETLKTYEDAVSSLHRNEFYPTLFESEFETLEEKLRADVFGPKQKKKVNKTMKKFLGDERHERFEEEENEEISSNEKKRNKKKKQGLKNKSGKNQKDKVNVKMGRKGKSRGFLRVPMETGIFIARDVWRLHTGRQYYVPITKKTLLNLGFVRQLTYGSLSTERPRTVLVEGSWKKAAGYYIDLFEKANQDPVTSIITTKKSTFDKLLQQLQQG